MIALRRDVIGNFINLGGGGFGSNEPSLDAEVIAMAWDIYLHLGLTNLTLELNSVGCPKCRKEHAEKLRAYLQTKLQDLCTDCRERFVKKSFTDFRLQTGYLSRNSE